VPWYMRFRVSEREYRQALRGAFAPDGRFKRIFGFEIAVGGNQVIASLLAQAPYRIIFGGSLEASLFEMQELYLQMVTQFAPGFGVEPHVEQFGVAIEVGVNQQVDHRFSPPAPLDVDAEFL
jgi:hypothetical protein